MSSNQGGDLLRPIKSGSLYFKVIATYIGSIIGAGFASGQEIMQFFIMYGDKAIYGVLISSILFAYLGAVVLYLSSKLKTSGYERLFSYVLGARISKYMDFISLVMLVGGLGIMLAGSGAIFSEHLGQSKYVGITLAAAITCLVILGGLQGVLMANAFLVPVKVTVIIAVCIWAIIHAGSLPQDFFQNVSANKVAGHWMWSAVLYVSYNMIVPVAVLSSLGQAISEKEGILSGITGGIGLGITAGIITLAGLVFYPAIIHYQVPLLYLAQQAGEHWQKLLGFLIWLAILTTAIADAHGFASRLAPLNSKKYKIIGVGITLITIPLAGVEFPKLVKNLYPLFGYAGLVLVFALLITPVYRRFFAH